MFKGVSPQLSAAGPALSNPGFPPHDCLAVPGAGSCDHHVTSPLSDGVDHSRRHRD